MIWIHEKIPDGPTTKLMQEQAKKYGMVMPHVQAGATSALEELKLFSILQPLKRASPSTSGSWSRRPEFYNEICALLTRQNGIF